MKNDSPLLPIGDQLKPVFEELRQEAYNVALHSYDVKKANQIIVKHFNRLVNDKTALVDTLLDEIDQLQNKVTAL